MRPALKFVVLAGVTLASVQRLVGTSPVDAQERPIAAKSARGGLIAKSEGVQFEVFFYPTGVRVFPTNASGGEIDASKLVTTATFYHPNAPDRPWFSRRLQATAQSADLVVGLAAAPPSGARVAFAVEGLPSGKKAAFTVPLDFVAQAVTPPEAPAVATQPEPRYIYAPGYYGYGYYAYPGPESNPQPAATSPGYYGQASRYSGMGSMSDHTVGPGHRDWTTGRTSPLAKPWLKPMD